MEFNVLKQILNENDLPVWKLAKTMGIATTTLYKYSHYDFKGHMKQLLSGLDQLGIDIDKITKGKSDHD